MEKMKKIIFYYSRTGTTKKIAEELSAVLDCDIEEIEDTKDRKGVLGYILSGKDAHTKQHTVLKDIKRNPSDYDLVIIGTPIWAWNLSTPIRTFLVNNKDKISNLAFFCTMGGSGAEKALEETEAILNKKAKHFISFKTTEVQNSSYKDKLKDFASKIKEL